MSSNYECTNKWPYNELVSASPLIPKNQLPAGAAPTLTTGGSELFALTFKKGKKSETMRFSSEYRSDILCDLLEHCDQFGENYYQTNNTLKFDCTKYHWSDKRIRVIIQVGYCSVNQIDPSTGKVICKYFYKDIDNLITLSDYPNGMIISHGGFGRYHLFFCDKNDELMKKICDFAWNYTGVVLRVKKDAISFDNFENERFGRFSNDESITSLCEFNVHKIVQRKEGQEPVKRIMALTDTCLIERDPLSYMIVTLKPLCEIFALVRDRINPQLFSIEYIKGSVRSYLSSDRDALLASLIDGVRSSGNLDIHVKMMPSQRGGRLGPYYVEIDEEVESNHLKFFQSLPNSWTFNDAVHRFNANCAYSGLLHSVTQDGLFAENKEKLIQGAISAFIDKEGDQQEISSEDLQQHFQALRRLIASKIGFASFTTNTRFRECLGRKIVNALKRNNDDVTHSAIDMLCALLQVSN